MAPKVAILGPQNGDFKNKKLEALLKFKTAVAQQASKEVETSLVSDFSPVFYRYTNVFL